MKKSLNEHIFHLLTLIIVVVVVPNLYAQNNVLFNSSLNNGIRFYNLHNYEKAIPEFHNFIAEDPNLEQPYILLSASYIQLKKFALAETAVQKGLLHFPTSQSLFWLYAEVLLQKKEYDKALKYYERIHKNYIRADKSTNIFSTKQLNMRLGELYQIKTGEYFKEKRFNNALIYAEKTYKIFPHLLSSFTNLISVNLKLKRYEQALKLSDEGLKLFPENIKLVKLKSSAEYGLHNYKSMLAQYKILYNKNPDDIDNAIVYGELLNMNRKYFEANKFFLKLLKRYPYNEKIYDQLLIMNENRGSLKGELNVLRLKQKYFPRDPSVYSKIATVYEAMKKWENARMVYDTLVTLTKDSLKYGMAKAGTFESQDSLQHSELLTLTLLKRYPENTQLIKNLGHLQKEQHEWPKALNTYQKLNKIHPGTDAYTDLGYIYEKLHNKENAYKYYYKAVHSGTNNPIPYWGLSKIFLNKNMIDSAFVFSNTALHKSLEKLSDEQNLILKNVKSIGNIEKTAAMNSGNKKAAAENKLTEQIFTFITKNFPTAQVKPVLDSLLVLYPGSGVLIGMEAHYYLSINDSVTAIKLYHEALGLIPGLRDAQMVLAKIYMNRKKYNSAIGYYSRAISLNPWKSDAYSGLIRAYRLTGNLDKLCNLWLLKYSNNPGNKTLKESLIEALDKAGRYDMAKKIISGEFNQ